MGPGPKHVQSCQRTASSCCDSHAGLMSLLFSNASTPGRASCCRCHWLIFPVGAVASYRPLRGMHSTLPDLVGPKQRDDEGMMSSSLAQLQPLSSCVLGNAKIGCRAGSLEDAGLWKLCGREGGGTSALLSLKNPEPLPWWTLQLLGKACPARSEMVTVQAPKASERKSWKKRLLLGTDLPLVFCEEETEPRTRVLSDF